MKALSPPRLVILAIPVILLARTPGHAQTITGSANNLDGTRIAGVNVKLFDEFGNEVGTRDVQTQADGTFTINVIGAVSAQRPIVFLQMGGNVAAGRFRPARTYGPLKSNEPHNVATVVPAEDEMHGPSPEVYPCPPTTVYYQTCHQQPRLFGRLFRRCR